METQTQPQVNTPNRSESINELAAALSKAQGAMGTAKKDASNPFFKSRYADLASVWEACRKPLSDNGLSVVQLPEFTDSGIRLETLLMHSSGQWMSSVLCMTPTKSDPQGIGSCITYARRYSLSAVVGICPEDDDGEAVSGKAAPKAFVGTARPVVTKKLDPTTQPDATPSPQPDDAGEATDEMKVGHIEGLFKRNGIDLELAKAWLAGHGCETLADISDKLLAKIEADPAKFKAAIEVAK